MQTFLTSAFEIRAGCKQSFFSALLWLEGALMIHYNLNQRGVVYYWLLTFAGTKCKSCMAGLIGLTPLPGKLIAFLLAFLSAERLILSLVACVQYIGKI
jgi:hypothetical protein